MHPAVNVQYLPRGHREEVAEEGEAGLGHGGGVVDVPTERPPVGPGVLEGAESRDRLGGHGADGPGRHEIHPDAAGSELLGQVARQGLESRLGHAHPVVDGPGHRRVEVETDDGGTAVASGRLEQREKGLDQGLERVGRDVDRRRDVAPVGGEHPAAQAVGRCEADGVQQAVQAVPAGGEGSTRRPQLFGRRDVDLEDLGLAGELARGAPSEREGAPRAREHDVRPLLLRQAGHGESQRGVGEDAGDEQPLAVEESHCARRLCEGRGVHVGLLGGPVPTVRGAAVRLAVAGIRVTIGSRDAERAATVASEVVARWPDSDLALGGADNAEAAEAELVVLATPWDSAVATVRSLREPLAGKVVISMVNALAKEGREMLALIPPRGSMAAAVQAAVPQSLVSPAFRHLPDADMENLESGLEADVLVFSDHPEATVMTLALVEQMPGLRPLDAGSLNQAAAIEAFTAVCITLNITHKAHSTLRIAGL